ncbi:MAG: hypothetical protein WCD69_28475 [Xanthobacteraceae bacterium]
MRSSLFTPSLSSARASAPKSESGATSNESAVQRSAAPLLIATAADFTGEEGAVLFALG